MIPCTVILYSKMKTLPLESLHMKVHRYTYLVRISSSALVPLSDCMYEILYLLHMQIIKDGRSSTLHYYSTYDVIVC